jgi:hypothetical protein
VVNSGIPIGENSVEFEVAHREDVSNAILSFRVEILILIFFFKQSTPFTTSIFESSAPSHAYPTKYPPTCPVDPFPTVNGHFVFSPPQWLRKPTTKRDIRFSPDIDELATLFANKLNLRDTSTNKSNTKKGPSVPWFAATHTVPCPSPLPALVRSTFVPKSQSRSGFHFGASSTLEPLAKSCSRTRKSPAFPKRIPVNHVSFNFHEESSSRTTSLGSASSGQSRSSSSSSLSSLCPPTPPLAFADPHHVIIDEQDLQVLDDLLACHSEQHATSPFFFDSDMPIAPYPQPEVHLDFFSSL